MGFAIMLSLALVVLTFVFHFHVLLRLGSLAPKIKFNTHLQVLMIVLVLFLAHLVEIGFYALIYSWSVSVLQLGEFQGAAATDAMSYIYYSGVIYTTLGLGDIQPVGHVRFITITEALSGFLLITWSASFTFLAMGRLWTWDTKYKPSSTSDTR